MDEVSAQEADARHGALVAPEPQVRETDLEPYVGLGYLSKLFRFIAIFLAILLAAEVVTGLMTRGREAIPTLLAEASRLIVLAGLLWGAGDLALLLIDIGHDVRATRILLGRRVAHAEAGSPQAPLLTGTAPPLREAAAREVATREL